MFESLVHTIEPLLQTYGVLGVFLASIIEEVVAPIPSTLVVFTAGLLLTQGQEGWDAINTIVFRITLPASLGITIGSLFPYFIARIGEKVAVERFGKYLGLSWDSVEKTQQWFQSTKSDMLGIFCTRAIPGLPSLAVSTLSGLLRVPLWRYLLASFLGCIPRNLILGFLAWWGGRQYKTGILLLNHVESGMLILIFAVLISVGGYWVISRRKNNIPKPVEVTES